MCVINEEKFVEIIDALIAQGGCSSYPSELESGVIYVCYYNHPILPRHCFAGHVVPPEKRPMMEEGGVLTMLARVEIETNYHEKNLITLGQGIHDIIATIHTSDAEQLPQLRKWKELVQQYGTTNVRACNQKNEAVQFKVLVNGEWVDA